ncbi:hypothetical protein CAPTEDRAFT_224221 [Capitella teleta]|uniref:Phospholipase B1, membrane-associated n=1 Tax=Capitella teleta TaxID=283909 RepID=R7U3Q1_CAPTE|nr:hypothetical protein CAPTEDRAFT_224221 [Capitella teleta]|eukprot:ELU00766.1 hypothetical protein CAPTEDRAFT_224221 [Capitella teleta]
MNFVWVAAYFLGSASAASFPQENDIEFPDAQVEGIFRTLKDRADHNATFKAILDAHLAKYDSHNDLYSTAINFECNLTASASKPTTAHEVRPSDINVIGAIGDSITAGFGITATNILQVLRNDRHLSWITGGLKSLDEGVVTLTNILRKFNAGLTGYSYARSLSGSKKAGLNLSVGGAVAADLDGQAKRLIGKMKDSMYGVDWENDWKLISLLIGGNDLCRYCKRQEKYSPESFAANIKSALDILHAEMPKTIVVLSNIFDITPLPAFSDGIICDIVQTAVCSCAKKKDQMQEAHRAYTKRVNDVINSGRYDRGRQDFTVVLMPQFEDAMPPNIPGSDEPDQAFWAPDCFHPGRKAHFAMATSTWNQMFEPVGEKRTSLDWQIGSNLVCPTENDPYIKTLLNSKR